MTLMLRMNTDTDICNLKYRCQSFSRLLLPNKVAQNVLFKSEQKYISNPKSNDEIRAEIYFHLKIQG